jgi:DNA-binding PadR family transcriptional regulator
VFPTTSESLQRHLEGLLLAVLETGPLPEDAVIEALRAGSGGVFDLSRERVDPVLRRLEHASLVCGPRSAATGGQGRTYRLTATGLAALGGYRAVWQEFSAGVSAILTRDLNRATTGIRARCD